MRPSSSWVVHLSVLTVKLAVPLASMVMEWEPIWPLPAKSPLSMIFTLTLMG